MCPPDGITVDQMHSIPACAVCGNLKPSPYLEVRGYYFLHCDSCGLVFRNPPRYSRERVAFLKESVYYDHGFRRNGKIDPDAIRTSHYDIAKARYLAKQIDRMVPLQAKTLLDVGAGAGYLLREVIRRGAIGVGIDLSQTAAHVAAKIWQVHTLVGSFPKDFLRKSMRADVVTFNDSLEHLESPKAALALVRKWLSPCGLLYIRTPNAYSSAFRRLSGRWRLLQPQDHLFLFSPTSLTRLLQSVGFEEVRIKAGEWLLATARQC